MTKNQEIDELFESIIKKIPESKNKIKKEGDQPNKLS
jgi:hypothetical protein